MDAFARGVAELGTFPDKGKIDVLAMLASDALGDAAAVPAFARLLLDGVYGAHPPRKLPLVYVIDAVVKMRGGAEFQAALAPEIAQCFESAYSQVGARGRPAAASLHFNPSSLTSTMSLARGG